MCGRRAAVRRARAAGPALPALPRVSDSILFLTRVSFGSGGWKSLFQKPKRNWLLLQPRRPGGRRRRPPEAVVLCYFANFPQIARKFFSAPRRPGRARLNNNKAPAPGGAPPKKLLTLRAAQERAKNILESADPNADPTAQQAAKGYFVWCISLVLEWRLLYP